MIARRFDGGQQTSSYITFIMTFNVGNLRLIRISKSTVMIVFGGACAKFGPVLWLSHNECRAFLYMEGIHIIR